MGKTNWKGKGLVPNRNKHLVELANIGFAIAKQFFNIELYYHQALIFYYGITDDDYLRLNIITTTRYGKTFTLSLIALYRARFLNNKVLIVAHNKDTSNLITTEVSQNLLRSSDIIKEGLNPSDKFERLAMELSKNGISYPSGGSIHSVSLYENDRSSGAIGFGADCLLIDESALVTDDEYSVAIRMALQTSDFKKIEISNPHNKNHFYRSINNSDETNIRVDKQIALEETRINQAQIDELKTNMTENKFKIFVECEFIDVQENKVFRIGQTSPSLSTNKTIVLGIDLGRFNDETVLVGLDSDCKTSFLESWGYLSFEVQKPRILNIWAKLGYPKVNLDMTGLGLAVFDSFKLIMGSKLEGITFTASSKKDLIQNLQILIEQGKHKVYDDQVHKQQIEEYEFQETKGGGITYSAPSGKHDDHVIALALAGIEFKPNQVRYSTFVSM